MKPIPFEEQNVVIAEDQDQYMSLPANIDKTDKHGPVVSCWDLSDEELAHITKTRQVWLRQLAFGQPLQPVLMSTNKWEVLDKDRHEPTLERGAIFWEDHWYWYERKVAKHGMSICLATRNPLEYCNGLYLYSQKNPGSGLAFVVTKTTNSEKIQELYARKN